jgi:MarR family transcriptional regulator, organic hydroperoxide resistance regulator
VTDEGAVLVALRRIVRFLRLADRDAEAACGLSSAQLFVLTTLASAPALSLAELASRALTDPSSISTVVARLVERGYVARRVGRSDRRRVELRLTAAGARTVLAAPRMPQARIISAIQAMPAARRGELVRVIEAFAGAIGANEVAPRMLFEDEAKPRRVQVSSTKALRRARR